LVVFALVQLVWGAMIRHAPGPISQRLHILTAFAVVAAAIWLAARAYGIAEARSRLGWALPLLLGLLLVQLTLGVDAWMGKFGPGVDPQAATIRPGQAIVRTLHVLVGTGVLVTSIACTLLLHSRPTAAAHLGEST
jgi:multisubunit Na+/H+ antiporter MnhB subunit